MRGLISITLVTDELDVEEVLDAELGDDALRHFHQPVVLQRLEVHRETGTHRLARLCMADQNLTRARDPIHGPLATMRELHHEQVRPAFFRQERQHVIEPHGEVARPLLDQLLRAVDGRVEDAKAA